MGACASAPKANKGDEAPLPPPEQPKVEAPAAEAVVGDDNKEEEQKVAAAAEESDKVEAPIEKKDQESTAEVLPISQPAKEEATEAATPKPALVVAA